MRCSLARRRCARGVAAVGLVAIALLVSSCSAGDDAEPNAGSTTPVSLVEGVSVEVRVLDNRFLPAAMTVEPGTEVRFVNAGRNDHNVIPAEEPAEGGFDLSVPTEGLLVGMEATVRFTEPGRYAYYCSIHGSSTVGMIGEIVVEG